MSAKLEQEEEMNEQVSKVARSGICAILTLYSPLLEGCVQKEVFNHLLQARARKQHFTESAQLAH